MPLFRTYVSRIIPKRRSVIKLNIKINKVSKEEAKTALIEVLTNQVVDLMMMSKIELGDDVFKEIKRLKEIINE